MSFAVKLSLGFGSIISLSLLVTAASYLYFNALNRANQRSTHTFETQVLRQNIFIDLVNIETGKQGYALAGRDEFLAPYEQGKKAIDTHLAALRQLTQGEAGQQELLAELEETYRKAILPAAEELIALRRSLLRCRGHRPGHQRRLQKRKQGLHGPRSAAC
jgi:methyl-accepting chemotaxis protein